MTSTPRVEVIERLARLTPMALRLSDTVTGEFVRGAEVTLTRVGQATRLFAFETPSATYAVRGVPSLVAWELRDALPDRSTQAPPVVPVTYRVEVRDPLGRFHDFTVTLDLPIEGLVVDPCGSPPEDAAESLPTYALPARPVPPGMAVVRAGLERAADGQPAAFAALEVSAADGAKPVRGIADRRGEVVVMFPYPQVSRQLSSAPGAARQPLVDREWPLDVRVFLPASPPADHELPDLCELRHQTPARLTDKGSGSEVTTATLSYGRELSLRSSGHESVLLVGA